MDPLDVVQQPPMCDYAEQPVVYCILSYPCNSIANGLFIDSAAVLPCGDPHDAPAYTLFASTARNHLAEARKSPP